MRTHLHRILGLMVLVLLSLSHHGWAQHEMVNGITVEAPPNPCSLADFHQLKGQTQAQWVAIVPYAMTRADDPSLRFNSPRQWWGERDEGVQAQIRMAHQAGLRVLLKPQVWIPGLYTGHMDFPENESWESWEKDYRDYILHYLDIAQAEGVEAFCVGTEMDTSVRKRREFWTALIQQCRERYDGKLTYAANWDQFMEPDFWVDLDAVGVNAYFPIRKSDLKSAWSGYQSRLEAIHRRTGKPVLFTEFGYRSVEDTLREPWEQANDRPISMEEQSVALEGLFESFWAEPPEWFAGGFLWKWKLRSGAGGTKDHGYTVQGKPALEIVRDSYAAQTVIRTTAPPEPSSQIPE